MAGTARSQSTDPFQMNRFHVTDTEGYLNLNSPAAGFNTATMPEINVGIIEYIEGLWVYKRKFPGEPDVQPVTLTKGVVKNDSSLFQWILAEVENRPYRSNLTIKHYHRDDVTGLVEYTNAKPYRRYECNNCWPSRVKLGSDFDATSGEISIEEIEITMESFRLFVNGTEVKAKTV